MSELWIAYYFGRGWVQAQGPVDLRQATLIPLAEACPTADTPLPPTDEALLQEILEDEDD